MAGGGSASLDREERRLLEDSTSGNRTQRYAIQAVEPSVGSQKISATASPPTSGWLTLQIAILWIILSEAQLTERSTKLCAAPKMNRGQRGRQHLSILTGRQKLVGYSEAVWRPWLKLMAIT